VLSNCYGRVVQEEQPCGRCRSLVDSQSGGRIQNGVDRYKWMVPPHNYDDRRPVRDVPIRS
jgi:hypothetical protein